MHRRERIKRDFNKAAFSYDKYATLQREVAKKLLRITEDYGSIKGNILDAGCGTGYLSKLILEEKLKANLFHLDLAYNMCKITEGGMRNICINADIEVLPFKENSFDIIYSSLALQWCNDLPRVFKNFNKVVKKGGFISFSTFGPSTLYELDDSFKEIDSAPHVNNFIDVSKISDYLSKSGFEEIKINIDEITFFYPSLYELFLTLKKIGASYKENSGSFTKSKLVELENIYKKKFAQKQGIPATWQIYFFRAKKI